jgi:thioredoxin reductase (NADPH)
MPEAASRDIAVDVLVVGAGPTGLYAAYYAGFRGLRVALMDSLEELGGQITAMYPEKLIYDVAGFPAIRGRDLVSGLVAQAGRFDPVHLLGHEARTLETAGDGVRVTTSRGTRVECGAVIITGGIGPFTPRPLPAGAGYEGRGLAYFVPRLADHAGKDVVVVGGGDSAFDWAESLRGLARSVTLVHRRDRFRAHPGTVRRVLDGDVRMITHVEVERLRGEGWVEAADVRDVRSGETITLKAQSVIAALGFLADLGPLLTWGLRLEGRQIVVDTRMATNLDRVYAAGDIADYPGKVRLISVGFGEAATAVNNAAIAIDPTADIFPGHSTDFPAADAPVPALRPA